MHKEIVRSADQAGKRSAERRDPDGEPHLLQIGCRHTQGGLHADHEPPTLYFSQLGPCLLETSQSRVRETENLHGAYICGFCQP
jgi:hypothetical protein